MRIKLSKSQWEEIGEKAGWENNPLMKNVKGSNSLKVRVFNTKLYDWNFDPPKITINPVDKYFEVFGSGDLKKAAYCYAVGDDLYRSTKEEIDSHTEILSEFPNDVKINRINVADGRIL